MVTYSSVLAFPVGVQRAIASPEEATQAAATAAAAAATVAGRRG